jgi:hypothetical protein
MGGKKQMTEFTTDTTPLFVRHPWLGRITCTLVGMLICWPLIQYDLLLTTRIFHPKEGLLPMLEFGKAHVVAQIFCTFAFFFGFLIYGNYIAGSAFLRFAQRRNWLPA